MAGAELPPGPAAGCPLAPVWPLQTSPPRTSSTRYSTNHPRMMARRDGGGRSHLCRLRWSWRSGLRRRRWRLLGWSARLLPGLRWCLHDGGWSAGRWRGTADEEHQIDALGLLFARRSDPHSGLQADDPPEVEQAAVGAGTGPLRDPAMDPLLPQPPERPQEAQVAGPGAPVGILGAFQGVAPSSLPETIVQWMTAQEKIFHLSEQFAHLEKSKRASRAQSSSRAYIVIVTSLSMS